MLLWSWTGGRRALACHLYRYHPRFESLESRTLLSVFTVDRLSDANAPGGGEGSDLAGDLRYCLTQATSGDDTVAFNVTGNITLQGALPTLGASVQIEGPGAGRLSVQGGAGGNYAIFTTGAGATVDIADLTITNGNGFYGGGLENDGTLTVADSVLTDNTAFRGAGIYNTGTLTVLNSTIANNRSVDNGGGIANFGPLTVTDSVLAGNTGLSGGAVYNFGLGSLTLSYSTLTGNEAHTGGGITNNSGQVAVSNSTLAGNSATSGGGGGLYNDYGGLVTIDESTLANNDASTEGGGLLNEPGGTLAVVGSTISGNVASTGGGIGNGGSLTTRNTILAGDRASAGPDLFGDLGSQGHNLVGNPQGGSGLADTDLLNVDPHLGPLQDNGGPTRTMALQPDSPAIDAGDNMDAPMWDQRGPRFLRIEHGTIDIGAFEYHFPPNGQPLPDPIAVQALLSPGSPVARGALPGPAIPAGQAGPPATGPALASPQGGQQAPAVFVAAQLDSGQPGYDLGLLSELIGAIGAIGRW
jgi:hypothetical protein